MRRVVVTGMGGVTAFGDNWSQVASGLLAGRNAVRHMPEWQVYDGLNTLLGAPVEDFQLPEHYTRKRIRSMGRVSLMATGRRSWRWSRRGCWAIRCSPMVKPASLTVHPPAAPARSASSPLC